MRKLLIIILFLQGFSAIVSGIEIIRTNGLGIPLQWLSTTPFSSFIIPGLILVCVVGGTSILACVLLIKNLRYALEASATAGFGIQIWIFVQLFMINQSSFLQVIYFSSGIIILILVFLLLRNKQK